MIQTSHHISSAVELRAAIQLMEVKKKEEGIMLKEQCYIALDSMKPINLIRNSFTDVVASEEIKDQIIGKSVGMATGYLSKVLFERVTNAPLKKILGTVLMMGISTLVAKHPETIKAVGNRILSTLKGVVSTNADDMEKDQEAE